MTQLWNLLIPPQQQSVLLNLYTPEVLRHLATSLGSKQWRDREAACVALTTFLPTKTWSKVRPTLMQLWTSGMRVLDDIRDSTRKAAISFMKVLSNHVIFYILYLYHYECYRSHISLYYFCLRLWELATLIYNKP